MSEQQGAITRKIKYAIVIAIVIALDQATKYWAAVRLRGGQDIDVIDGLLKFNYTENSGIAFGMLAGLDVRWMLVAISVAAVIIVIYYMLRTPAEHSLLLWALAFVAGGIVGNLIDRILMGRVIDFILAYYRDYEFPVFNVADTAITTGAALLAIELFITPRGEKKADDSKPPAAPEQAASMEANE
jgi:signal peptidase II